MLNISEHIWPIYSVYIVVISNVSTTVHIQTDNFIHNLKSNEALEWHLEVYLIFCMFSMTNFLQMSKYLLWQIYINKTPLYLMLALSLFVSLYIERSLNRTYLCVCVFVWFCVLYEAPLHGIYVLYITYMVQMNLIIDEKTIYFIPVECIRRASIWLRNLLCFNVDLINTRIYYWW